MDANVFKELEKVSTEIDMMKFPPKAANLMFDTLLTIKTLLRCCIEDDNHEFNNVDELKTVMKSMYAYIHITLSKAQPEK